MTERRAWVERITEETAVGVTVTLRPGTCTVATGVGFLDHMLTSLGRHAGIGLEVEARGDLHVDAHHTVEDVGLTLGQALDQLLGDRAGLARFGFAYAPMDEALARAVLDLSGRPFCRVAVPDHLLTAWVTREFPLTLVGEFWRAVASRARLTLHLDLERGVDPHHCAEALFKAASLALRQAISPGGTEVPSAKGTLTK
ncbi:MAG: imidazoleglycerol-phosphate dehydratase [Thermoanaerobaculaceae bacterium]|jgi:imidazoleglycerol-phosphate dehydratase|nr:imidazoleglycerol-phosphate dehydratase [Thermoanaerobaculaceae bacterium]